MYYDAYETETKVFQEFQVELLDPCLSAILTIDQTVFQDSPAVTLTQYVNYASLYISWDYSIITSSLAGGFYPCGSFSHTIEDYTSGSSQAINANIFTEDLSLPTKTLAVQTNDSLETGSYVLRLTVFYTAYPSAPS